MSKQKIKVGLLGCGTIGFALAEFIQKELATVVRLVALHDHHPDHIQNLKKQFKLKISEKSVSQMIETADFLIEAASVGLAKELIPAALKKNKSLLILSVGALSEIRGLDEILKKSKGSLWIPSGAVAGIDGLLAAKEAGLKSVLLKTSKPPKGLMGALYFEKKGFPVLKGTQEKCVFKGSAKQAIKAFPKNVNVAAILSLAGLGFQKTQVEVWTSKKYKKNTHEVFVEAKSGKLHFKIENEPSKANPKTSALAFYSAQATLRKALSRIKVGC